MKRLLKLVLLLAIVGIGAFAVYSKTKLTPYGGTWESGPNELDRVQLLLSKNGTFTGSEVWIGDETKPGPNYKMSGKWNREGDQIVLSDIDEKGKQCRQPLNAENQFRLPISGRYLLWDIGALSIKLQQTASPPQ